MSHIIDARAFARGDKRANLHPSNLADLPDFRSSAPFANLQKVSSRRGFLGRLAALSASALAAGVAVGAAGPVVASAALPAPVAPALDPDTRALLEELLDDLDGGRYVIRDCGFVAMWKPGTSEVYFTNPRASHPLPSPRGWVPLVRDADDRIRAILAAGGVPHA